MINQEMWADRWIRYEISQAMACAKGLLAVCISGAIDRVAVPLSMRPKNPFEHVGIGRRPDGQYYLCERTPSGWDWYRDHEAPVDAPNYLQSALSGQRMNRILPLSVRTNAYDYLRQNGEWNLNG